MSLSFEESLYNSGIALTADDGIAAYDSDDGNWIQDKSYEIYSMFTDDSLSTISASKDITLSKEQINLTQEENSQYIPFEMNRRYDGYDLTTAAISIHYTNKNGEHYSNKPINVMYNDNKIRFGWLIGPDVTMVAGALSFEIHAYGTVISESGTERGYTWKTKPNKNSLTVLQSLCDCTDDFNKIDDTWMQELITDIVEKVTEQIANAQLDTYVTAAESAATRAETAANDAESTANNIVNNALTNYYTKTEVDRAIASIDVTEQLESYATQEYVNDAIAGVTHFTTQVVSSINEVTQVGVLYLIKDSSVTGADKYNEYLYIEGTGAVLIGDTTTDLANYVTNEALAEALAPYAKTADIDAKIGDLGEHSSVVEYIKAIDVTKQLGDYYTKTEADAATATALEPYAKTEEINAKLGDFGESTVKDYIDELDVSDQLTEYAKTTEVNAKIGEIGEGTVKDYVDTSIANMDIENKLTKYAKTEEVNALIGDLGEHETVTEYVDALDISGQLENYATKTYVDNKETNLNASITSNTEKISTLNTTVAGMQTELGVIDKSPRLTYDVAYNDVEDADVGENTFVFYEITNEGQESEVKSAKRKFKIVGGGGASTSSTLKIGYITTSPYVVTVDDKAVIKYTFSGVDSNNDPITEGNATWKIGSTVIATSIAVSGENEFDATPYLSIGSQKLTLSITDDAGSLATKSWTVQKVDVRLESTFNDTQTYPANKTVSFSYTPYGAVSKEVHFILDGNELESVTTSSSGIIMDYTLPAQEHGAHLLEVYMTATINNNTIESNHIFKDIIWYDETSTVPVISTIYQEFTARQYDATNIVYTVYDPSTESPTVEIAVDDKVVSSQKLESATNTYSYKTSEVGEHIITITCGETVKTLTATITKLDITVTPITAGLVFDFNPAGKSNSDTDKLWTDGTYSMSVSENFDWVNGGYQLDENGDQYFCIKAGTTAEINYELFADDAKKNGKEFKLIFKTTNIANPDAKFLHCIDNTTETNHIGIEMRAQEATIYGSAGSLVLPYSEEDIIEFEFNISKDTEAIPMVMGYEDGVSTRPMVYDSSYNFTQNTPKIISLGSEYCDLLIYRFKVYNSSLSDKSILNNFIADARNAEEMIARHTRNQIYDENQNLDPDVLAKACPQLRVYKISAPYFTNNKSDKVPKTTIQQIYGNGDKTLDNWICYNCMHSGQGTSSNNYGAAGRNLDFIMNKSGIENVEPYFVLGDGTTRTDKITMTRSSVPVAYLNAKVNIASSNNMTNAMLATKYNEFNPYKRPFVREEGFDTSIIKDTMEFHNCVIFIQETDTTTDAEGNYTAHREFNDTNWHFYAIGNIGDSKKTDKTRLTDPSDKYECCVEIMDVELPLSDFPTDTMMNAMGYTKDDKTGEIIYTWAKDENLGILYELIDGEYVLTQDTTVNLEKVYYVDILEHDDFSEDYTYGWRYLYEDGTDEENAEVFDYCKQKWIEFYRFVTTATDEEFKANLKNYFVVDSALYNYLFTTRYTMVDNRAKNTFWHYGWTGEYDTDGNKIRKWDLSWGYDMDTSLGLNNYGVQVYRYGLEDTDVDENGEEIFREMDSQFFCRVRDSFTTELKAMFQTLESQNAWQAASFISKADAWQSEFPEELWRVDIERKYIRTYNGSFINGKGDAQFLKNMSNGKMKYHRRQWERNQEKYMASKYQTSLASGDSAILRCTSFEDTTGMVILPNYSFTLTPYSYMWLNVQYGEAAAPIPERAEPNKTYTISPSPESPTDIIKVFSSSSLRSLGNLSAHYAGTIDTSKASKIQELQIGNETVGYDNANLKTLTTGANYLLETLNIENVSGLKDSLDLSLLNNLKTLYAHGSNISGVKFADGGRIETAELPAITAMTLKNLMYLTTLDITGYNNLTDVIIENCNTSLDLISLINNAVNLNRIRITGINWALESTDLLDRLYTLKGFDKLGYNINQSVVAGKVTVPVIKSQQLANFNAVWPDLEIIYEKEILQYAITFKNADGTVFENETQYVDQGEYIINPSEREANPFIPTLESSVEYNYTFAGWRYEDDYMHEQYGSPFDDKVYKAITLIADYTSSVRTYTITYMAANSPVQITTDCPYGSYVPYTGETPTHPQDGIGDRYYLFNRWKLSGFVDGDKTIEADFSSFDYTGLEYFKNKIEESGLESLAPVEIHAIIKNNIGKEVLYLNDTYTITLGNDINYDDIDSVEIEPQTFDGTNSYDTGIKLFDVDKDFVIAIDYEFSADTPDNSVLAQCYLNNGSTGFKLQCSDSNVSVLWGTTASSAIAQTDAREVVVLRHKQGDPNITIYSSNLGELSVGSIELINNKMPGLDTHSLVFGAAQDKYGTISNNAIGSINWAKVWYKDLGDDICKTLAMWPHEQVTFGVFGGVINDPVKRYELSDETGMCSFSLIGTHLLNNTQAWNLTRTAEGGWASAWLNTYLNTRVYGAMSPQIQSLIKQVRVKSWNSDASSITTKELTQSDCYITLPCLAEVSDDYANHENYSQENEGKGAIPSIGGSDLTRKRGFRGEDIYQRYFLRTPQLEWQYSNAYVWGVTESGSIDFMFNPTYKYGILMLISF